MKNNLLYRNHLISIMDLNKEQIELLINATTLLKKKKSQNLLQNKVIGSLFFEASTRTRLSFETAVYRQQGSIIGFADHHSTSLAAKGESLADSIKVISSYTDAIVIRHPQEGSARLASEFSSVPVINAGDGSNQHPTQTLLDLFTIKECQQTLNQLTVACVGDLKYGRTVHSLAHALSLFNTHFLFLAPEALQIPNSILTLLEQRGCTYHFAENLEEVTQKADILYMTRIQKERFDETEFKHLVAKYILQASHLEACKPNLKVLHPLPRREEIHPDVDHTQHAYYFQQAENGVYARQALLALILNPNAMMEL